MKPEPLLASPAPVPLLRSRNFFVVSFSSAALSFLQHLVFLKTVRPQRSSVLEPHTAHLVARVGAKSNWSSSTTLQQRYNRYIIRRGCPYLPLVTMLGLAPYWSRVRVREYTQFRSRGDLYNRKKDKLRNNFIDISFKNRVQIRNKKKHRQQA